MPSIPSCSTNAIYKENAAVKLNYIYGMKKKTATKKVGRPPTYHFDRQRILDRVIWATREWFAQDYGCSADAFDDYVKREFGCNYTELKRKRREEVGGMLLMKSIDLALKGNVTLLIFLMKSMLGMSEQQPQEVPNMNGLTTFLNKLIKRNDDGTSAETT